MSLIVRIQVLALCLQLSSGSPDSPGQTLALRHTQDCPGGWKRFGSSCYGIGDSADTWSGAMEICGKFGATLAEVESSGEHEFLKEIARSRGYARLWLGGIDIFNEGHFEWAGSKELIRSVFTNWATGQPDDFQSNEDCVHLNRDMNYQWNDAPCNRSYNFACERKVSSDRLSVVLSGYAV